MPITGSCHCGAVAYTLDEDRPSQAMACNCSICRRKGHLLHFTTPDKFTLHTDRGALASYRFNRHIIAHHFCKTCGCSPFSEGVGPDGSEVTVINLRCADDLDADSLHVHHFNGAVL